MIEKRNQNLPENLPPIYHTFETIREYTFVDMALFHAYDFFDWWYVKMPILLFRIASRVVKVANDQLSFSLLWASFFVPWHRDRKPVGYLMGIVMRVIYIPIAFTILAIVSIFSFAIIILWILLPIISIIMLLLSPLL